VKTVVLFLVINRASMKAATASAAGAQAHSAGSAQQPLEGGSVLGNPLTAYFVLGLISSPSEENFFYDNFQHRGNFFAISVHNADLATGSQVKSDERVLDDLFTGHSKPAQPPTSSQINNGLSDPNLDTGHYDDGHAFGWNVKTESQQKDLWLTVITDFTHNKLTQVVDGIENFVHTDLNADGKTGTGSGTGTGGSCSGVGTTASQTLTDPSPQVGVQKYDFATVIPATCDVAADAHMAIYVVNDADGSVISCVQDISGPTPPSPPPGQSACPNGRVDGPLPGDAFSSVSIHGSLSPQGSVWHIPVEVRYGTSGGQASVHLVYSWQPGAAVA
jgi:hypothetical protein